jgi:hypothetical protein
MVMASLMWCWISRALYAARDGLASRLRRWYDALPRRQRRCAETVRCQKEVDELRETLHNLAPLLLTNKTIRKRSKAVPNTSSLKINSR